MRAHLITIGIIAAFATAAAITVLATHLFGMIGLGIMFGGIMLFWFYTITYSMVK